MMGQKYAAYDDVGNINGFYDSNFSPAPASVKAIEITDGEWRACLSTPGYSVVNGSLTSPATPTASENLAAGQLAQSQVVDAACAAAIVSGLACDALVPGTPYTYPSKLTDQQNLASSVLSSVMPGLTADWTTAFWCADASGTWGFRDHTAAQIQAVGVAAKLYIIACITKKIGLEAQISAATTVAAVQAVVWS